MMTEHPNALLIKQAWLAVSHSDIETLKEIWSDDIVWHVTADNPWHGDHCGPEAIFEYLAQVGESGESYDTSLKSILANDEYAALVCHVSTKRGNHVLEVDQVLFARIEDRRVAEVWTLSLDPSLVSHFWEASRRS